MRDVQMDAELKAATEAVKRQEQVLSVSLTPLAARLRHKPPQVVLTCARGSSAHAATFGKHLIERYLGIPVAACVVADYVASPMSSALLWSRAGVTL